MTYVVFVPTLVDADNINAQVGNARAILSGWDIPGWKVAALAYGQPDRRVAANKQIEVTRLWRRHAWMAHLFLKYLKPYDLIFYPGVYTMDTSGLRWRRRLGLRAPVVVTLEGLLGNEAREAEYSALAGHPVFCQRVPDEDLARVDERNRQADHIIAISPFLTRMGTSRFGGKFSTLPLGIDCGLFHPGARKPNRRPAIVSAGGVKANKRPEYFLELAKRNPSADFVWYGDGDMRGELIARTAQLKVSNLEFPGALAPRLLGDAFRAADIFVMPSKSEGVPKATQEAAACGLAQVIFGYYEAPSVVDGQNGFVVWDDESLFQRVGQLIDDPALVATFGEAGADMARAWDWGIVSRRWRDRLIEIAENRCA